MALVTKVGGIYVAIPMSLYIYDSFDRANSSTLGNADTGQTWETVLGAYTFGISSNAAYATTASQQSNVVLESGTNNVTITATMSTYADYYGLLFRYTDANNYWTLQNTSRTTLYFSGKSGGTPFGGATGEWIATGLTISSGSVLKAVCNGTSVKAYLNDTLVINLTKSEAQNGTKHGLSAYSTEGRLNNYSIVSS